ncbi:MAG TPA: hypothetical protein VFM93_13320 [Candidatus Limnocylindria bacterium]|nr:hypothetical protein [Candidatus Limnocylindria bacterium]
MRARRHARTLILILTAAVASASLGGTAWAKIPYFSVDVTPPDPVAGEPVLIVVRFWHDAAHTRPEPFAAGPWIDRLLALRRVGAEEERAVPLRDDGGGGYRASVTFDGPGEWHLVAFPDRCGWSSPEVPPGYVDRVALTVRAPGATAGAAEVPASEAARPELAAVAAGAVLLALATTRWGRRR